MTIERQNSIRALLKGIETGDPDAVIAIHPETYIQHNPQTHEGRTGLAALFKRLSETSPRVNIVRSFSDGDYVFAHTEYDFATRRIGFEVFRFEGDLAVEHWDNIQPRRGPNRSGHTMVSGPILATDPDRTEANRAIVRAFVKTVLIEQNIDLLPEYVDTDQFIEHNPNMAGGLSALHSMLSTTAIADPPIYQHLHRVLADGDFALAVSEGMLAKKQTAFYDLFRLGNGKLVEHWDTVEAVAPQDEWKNDNGKF